METWCEQFRNLWQVLSLWKLLSDSGQGWVPYFEEDLSVQASPPKLPVLCLKWILEAKANSTTHFEVTEAHSSPYVAMRRGILEGTQSGGGLGVGIHLQWLEERPRGSKSLREAGPLAG